eukprot:TRINITY_DN19440_c0_g1_i2.p1 TRINITY_DN19440_c0_g1~~TRINITY_DN19440_c0_g1_i2.p1  ORF type:complete len:1136 (+),score=120.67 TRINITY_DN19440_c0_g1_i2:82-3489(+)
MARVVSRYRAPLLTSLCCYGSTQLVNGLERAGMTTSLPSSGTDSVFTGASARYIVTVEAAGARCAVPADFDQDGDLDLVVVSSNDNTVAWYERLANGAYGTKQMISRMSNGARIVTTGDIDQDGLVDVVVASYYDHTVGWFRNTGSKSGGLFGPLNIITRSAIAAQGVSVADLDGDGDLDVLSASSGDNTVAWYENLGGGKFCEVKNIVDANSKGVRTVIAADLNEDGHLDLAVASKDDGSITWYKNDGKQSFEKIVIDSTAKGAYSLVAEDVDKDGHIDLVTAANMEGHPDNGEGEGGMVSFYRNGAFADGELCNFQKVRVTAGGSGASAEYDWFVLSVWAGDLDGDGDIDIASASFGLLHQGGISWYENTDGSGNTWTRHQIYESLTPKTGHYVFGADMDGDGDTDLIATTNGDNTIAILTASTACDGAPKASCCRSEQYWDATTSTCKSCAAGSYLDNTGATPTCRSCNSDCPRPGLAFQPASCHSVPSCADLQECMRRCDCGADRYLDEDVGVCINCPDGHSSTNDTTRALADYNLVEKSFLDGTNFLTSDYKWQGFNASRCVLPFCQPGQRFDVSTKICLPCPAGSFSKTGTLLECEQCPRGHFCGTGAQVPTPCLVGTYAETVGSSICTACSNGKVRPELWTTMEQVLNKGRLSYIYKEAAANKSLCGCDVGARSTGDQCVECGEGMACMGKDDVFVENGYYAADDSYSIFRCGSAARCTSNDRSPGNSCAAGREAIACGLCEPGLTAVSNGGCRECNGADFGFFVFTMLLAVGVLVGLYFSIESVDRNVENQTVRMASTICGIIAIFLQQLAILGQLSVNIKEPMERVVLTTQLIAIDLDIVGFQCIVFVSPAGKFAAKLFMVLLCTLVIIILHTLFVLARHDGQFRQKLPTFVNVVGTIFTIFYVTVTSTTLEALHCKSHPNGKWTARKYESVVCWESDEHNLMLGLGILAVFVPIAYLAHTIHVVIQYPLRVQSDEDFKHMYDFLFGRFRPQVHWYALVSFARGLLISVVPILPNPVIQLLIFQLAMIAQLFVTAKVQPYVRWQESQVEVILTACVLLLASVCYVFIEVNYDYIIFASWFGLVSLLVCFVGVGGLVGQAVLALESRKTDVVVMETPIVPMVSSDRD